MRKPCALLLAFCFLAYGCAIAPNKPASASQEKLQADIQKQIHYPDNPLPGTPIYGDATALFTYDHGTIKDVSIVKSTGNPVLDASLKDQLLKIKLQLTDVSTSSTYGQFKFEFEIYNPGQLEMFKKRLFDAIKSNAVYPKGDILKGSSGNVSVTFDYERGKLNNARISQSSHDKLLDAAALDAVFHTFLPLTPEWISINHIQLLVKISFSVIDGRGTKVSNYEKTIPPKKICSEVGFEYLQGKIENARLLESSGNAEFDKSAVTSVAQGSFTPPPSKTGQPQTDFKIAVCYEGK